MVVQGVVLILEEKAVTSKDQFYCQYNATVAQVEYNQQTESFDITVY